MQFGGKVKPSKDDEDEWDSQKESLGIECPRGVGCYF